MFRVQLFVGVSINQAFLAKYKLIDKGYISAFIEQKRLSENTTFYYVFTGEYQREERAREVISEISKSKFFRRYSTPFLVKP